MTTLLKVLLKTRSLSIVAVLIGTIGLGVVFPLVTSGKSLVSSTVTPRRTGSSFNRFLSNTDGGDQGRIAFVSNRGGNNDIYVMRPDGTGVVNITNHPASDRLPAWSPDGSKIAFRSTRNGNTEIYVMNDDGSNVVRLTFHPAVDTSPSWTPEGRVLFSSNRSGRFEIYLINADGTDLKHIDIPVEGALTFPSESPEGHRLAFTVTNFFDAGAIWIAHPDGSHPERLTPNELVAAFPDWSPFGNRLAFSNNVCPVCDLSEILVVNQGGNDIQQLTASGDAFNDLLPRWSPDGSRIVFSRDDFVNATEIYIMNADGTGVTNVTQHPSFDFEADWGP